MPASQTHANPVEEEDVKMTSNQVNGVSNDAADALVKPDIQCSERPISEDASLSPTCSKISTPSIPAAAVNSGSIGSSLAASTEMAPPPQSLESNKSSKVNHRHPYLI